MEDNFSRLMELGLTKGEARVYLALLRGSSKKSEIMKDSGVSSSVVYEILGRLEKKGLACCMTVDGGKNFHPAGPEKLLDVMEEEKKRVGRLEKNAKEIVPLLKQIAAESIVFAKTYRGVNGLKAMLRELGDEIVDRKIGEWLAMGVTSYKGECFNRLWLDWHREMRAGNKIRAKFIFCEKGTRYYKRLGKIPLTEVRRLASAPMSCITVAGDVSLIMKYADPPCFLYIKDPDIAGTMKEIFNFLWKAAKR